MVFMARDSIVTTHCTNLMTVSTADTHVIRNEHKNNYVKTTILSFRKLWRAGNRKRKDRETTCEKQKFKRNPVGKRLGTSVTADGSHVQGTTHVCEFQILQCYVILLSQHNCTSVSPFECFHAENNNKQCDRLVRWNGRVSTGTIIVSR